MILEGFFGDIEAKMVATWAKLEPSWQQNASKMGHVSVVGWGGWGILAADLSDVGSSMAFYG